MRQKRTRLTRYHLLFILTMIFIIVIFFFLHFPIPVTSSYLFFIFFGKVSLWDHIVQEKEHASFQVKVPTKYPLIDQVCHLFLIFLDIYFIVYIIHVVKFE
jgi:hypothetical protein